MKPIKARFVPYMALLCVMALAGGRVEARPLAVKAERQVLAAEDAFAQAVVARDPVVLAASLSDRLVYVHANGLAQDHDHYLHDTVAGVPAKIAGIAFEERQVQLGGAMAYVQGVVVYEVGQKRRARYVSIWRRAADGWHLAFWQNTAWP